MAAAAALLAAAPFAPARAPAATLATTQVLAKSGDPVPDASGTLFEIEPQVVLGDSGQVAFFSDIRDQGFLAGSAIFRCCGPAGLAFVVRSDWPAPDGNGTFRAIDVTPLAIDASGHVAFGAELTGTFDRSETPGIFVGGDGMADLVQIARGNETLPGSGDRIVGLDAIGQPVSLNDASQAAFAASFGSPPKSGYLRGDGTPGSLVEIARTGEPTPDGMQTLLVLQPPATLLPSGAVGFGAVLGPAFGIFRGNGGALTEIVRTGDASPDGNGSFATTLFHAPAFDDAGEAIFYATLTGTSGGSSDDAGIFRGDGDQTVVIARRGDLVPGGNGRLLDLDYGSIAVNGAGQVLFRSTITGATGGSDEGVFRGDGQSLETIARAGDPTPGGDGVFDSFEPLTLALNAHGMAVFQAFVDFGDGGTTHDSEGIFAYDDAHGLVAVARVGDVVPGAGTIDALVFTGATTSQGAGTSGLDASGEVAYRLAAGGDFFVAKTAAPEPGAGPLAAAAALALAARGRRAARR